MSGATSQPTILAELGVQLPSLDATHALTGKNTTSSKWATWPAVENWEEWADFNYENLRTIFRAAVEAPWQSPPSGHLSAIDRLEREIFDEKSLDSHLTKHTMPLVNAALVHANRQLGRPEDDRGHLWASGRGATTSGRPDWSLCTPNKEHPSGLYVNLVPGDTKLSTKWKPSMRHAKTTEWALPIRQVQSYGHDLEVRYGFIITDAHLVVLRFRREEIAPGTAQNRSRRIVSLGQTGAPVPSTPSGTRSRTPSPGSGGSTSIATSPPRPPSAARTEESTYSDRHHPTNDFKPPQYCAIPWTHYNKTTDGKASSRQHPVLTVRLALFYLSLLARYSPDTSIGYDYPPLDSWTETAAGFVHNSTGKTVAQRPQNATVIDRPPSAQGSRSSSATRSQGGAGGNRATSATRSQPGNRSASASRGDRGDTGPGRTPVRFATGGGGADPAGGPGHTTATHAAGATTPAPHGSQGGGLPTRSRQTDHAAGSTGAAGPDGTGGPRRSARTAAATGGSGNGSGSQGGNGGATGGATGGSRGGGKGGRGGSRGAAKR